MLVVLAMQQDDELEGSMALQRVSQSFTSFVQRKGQVTIPLTLRKSLNIQPGDEVYLKQSENGILITTKNLERLARFNEALDELSDLIAQKEAEAGDGELPSLAAVIEEIREQRTQILAEKYGVGVGHA